MHCPGYRDPLDQNFRDESSKVIKRAERQYKVQAENASRIRQFQIQKEYEGEDSSSSASSPDTMVTIYTPSNAKLNTDPSWMLWQSIEELAVTHFMSSYIPGSQFEYLPFLYNKSTTESGVVLPATIHAASLASLARDLGENNIMKTARQTYAKALVETNAALADPKKATDDATLISVLLLSLFEALVWEVSNTAENWTAHSQGALALIKLRGEKQFETAVGRRLFTQVVNITCVNSMQARKRLPKDLVDLVNKANSYNHIDIPRFRLASLTRQLSHLVADADEGLFSTAELVHACRTLEAKYVAFTDSFPPTWRYEVIRISKPRPEVYGYVYHRYPVQRIAKLWNTTRMSRVLLVEVQYYQAKLLADKDPHMAFIMHEAREKLMQLCLDIAASIPQFTDPTEFGGPLEKHFPTADSLDNILVQDVVSPKASAATLMWPLSCIRGVSLSCPEIRAWAKERLGFLGRRFHIPLAERATMGEDDDHSAMDDGLHMFYVS